MIMDNVATKADLQDIKRNIRNEIHSVRYEMNDRFKDVNHRIDLVCNQVTEMNKKFEFRFTEMDKKIESRLNGQNAEFSLKVEKMTNKLGVIVISSMSALGVLISVFGILIKYF